VVEQVFTRIADGSDATRQLKHRFDEISAPIERIASELAR
jgi:hypothetical protein